MWSKIKGVLIIAGTAIASACTALLLGGRVNRRRSKDNVELSGRIDSAGGAIAERLRTSANECGLLAGELDVNRKQAQELAGRVAEINDRAEQVKRGLEEAKSILHGRIEQNANR